MAKVTVEIEDVIGQFQSLGDEINRLREALQQVACSCWPEPGCSKGPHCKEYIARAALEGNNG